MLNRIIILVLMIGLVSAVGVDLDCPDEVFVDEEFECEVEVDNGDEVYDLKVEVDSERDSVLRIWDGEWKSSYYYLKGFIEDEEVVRLKVKKKGRFDVVVKLRYGEWREEFDCGRIRVLEGEEGEEDNGTRIRDRIAPMNADSDEGSDTIVLNSGDSVIPLGEDTVADIEEEWDYVSKDGRIVDWLPYGFCLFLIFLVGVLIWDRR